MPKKTCIDCLFCTDENGKWEGKYLRCGYQQSEEADEITGEPPADKSKWFCDTARSSGTLCGERARWWKDALSSEASVELAS